MLSWGLQLIPSVQFWLMSHLSNPAWRLLQLATVFECERASFAVMNGRAKVSAYFSVLNLASR